MAARTGRSDFAAGVEWPEAVAIAAERLIAGTPEASTLVLDAEGPAEVGLWRVSEGEFTTVHEGYDEYITILAGRGRLIAEDGEVLELSPGVSAYTEDGYRGRWVIDEPLVKSYAVIPTR